MNFEYDVIDTFDDGGQKVAQILSDNAIFIDCQYLHKDLYSMVFDLANLLREGNYGLFILARVRLNQILVYLRDELEVCEYVPEIDIKLRN